MAAQVFAGNVTTFPVIEFDNLAALREEFEQTCSAFPEFILGARPHVLGTMGALGNPASFHNQLVRRLRAMVHPKALEALRELTDEPGNVNVHQLFSRMCVRPAMMEKQSECFRPSSWSSLPAACKGDVIWEGWLNLGPGQQYFCCYPDALEGSGSGLSEEQSVVTTITIEPGHAILFKQRVHQSMMWVKYPADSYRLFLGFRTTPSSEPAYDVDRITTEMVVPLLPSGEKSPMFSSMHDSGYMLVKETIPWSDKCIKPEWRVHLHREGKMTMMCPRIIYRGVAQYYPPYSPEELAILRPKPLF